MDSIACPLCGEEYVHHEARTLIVSGGDNYEANPKVRGSVISIPMWCENGGHCFNVNLGFHKGFTFIWCEEREGATPLDTTEER